MVCACEKRSFGWVVRYVCNTAFAQRAGTRERMWRARTRVKASDLETHETAEKNETVNRELCILRGWRIIVDRLSNYLLRIKGEPVKYYNCDWTSRINIWRKINKAWPFDVQCRILLFFFQQYSTLNARKKLFLWIFFKIINNVIDVGFVRLNKYTLEIH